jgi:SPOR domain
VSDDLSIPNPGYRGNRAGRYGTGPSRARPGMDPDTRRLVMFAGGLGAVLLVLIGASAFVGHHSGEIPVVSADNRPIRVKPDNPGGMKIDGAENDVFSGGADTTDSKLAPPPEDPDSKALRSASSPPPPADPTQATTDAPPASVAAPVAPPAGPSVAPLVAPPVKRPQVATTGVPANSGPTARSPAIAAAKPAPIEAARLHVAAVDSHPPASGHQAMVQLAALPSEDAAHNEWLHLSKRMPELLNGKQPNFSRTERDGHVFWRLRTSGFADIAQARAFCDHVRAKGGGCSVADF